MLPAGNYWLLVHFHVDWVLLRGIIFSMWCHFPVVLFPLKRVEDNGTRCDPERSSSPSFCPAGSTVLNSFPTDVCLTPAVSCRQKSKITKKWKWICRICSLYSFPCYVHQKEKHKWRCPKRSVWTYLIMIESSNCSILCYVLNKTLKQVAVAQMMNVYYFILKVIV